MVRRKSRRAPKRNETTSQTSLSQLDDAEPCVSRINPSALPALETLHPNETQDLPYDPAHDPIYGDYPLEGHLHQMRLIKLKPGDWSDRIECDLEVVGLGERVEFEAVSYVWGKSFSEEPVFINGHLRNITLNLHSALRHFRHKTEIRHLWADAISINQKDGQERNQQVKLMRKIYTECSGVLIWLGEPPNQFPRPSSCIWTTTFGYQTSISNTDRQHLEEFWQSFSRYYNKPRAFRFDQTQDFTKGALCFVHILARDSHFDDDTVPFFQSDDCRRNVINALQNIMERQWWNRMWVIQETVLAKKATLHYGRYTFPWEMLTEAARFFLIHRNGHCGEDSCTTHYAKLPSADLQTIIDFANKVGDLDRWRKVWQRQPDSVFLLQLLRQFRRRETTDPKDKVYALIPLVTTWGKAEHMEVHYEWTDAQVYHLLVRHLIEVSESILVLMGTTEKSLKLRNHLPSWVPDWTVKGDEYELARLLRTPLYKASGVEATSVPRYLGLKGEYLELEGLLHDIVSDKVGHVMPAQEEHDILQVFSEWHHLAGMSHPDHIYADKDIKRYDAWWRTLCMDTIRVSGVVDDEVTPLDEQEYERAGKDYGQEYLSWRYDDTRPLQPDSPGSRAITSRPLFELTADPVLYGPDTMEFEWYPSTPPPRLHRKKTFKRSPNYPDYEISSPIARKRSRTTPPRTSRDSPILDGKRFEMVAVEEAITTATTDRRFFLTEKGYMGLGPKAMRKGDVVFILRGGQVPFLLRPAGRENVPRVGEVDTHVLVGDCYVHGIMDGEAVPKNESDWKKLYLV